MNKAIICGRLGRDPETKYSQAGKPICKLNVATSHRVKRGDSWEDATEWHRVTAFGKTAENCEKFLAKGREVLIEGRIHTSSYEKNGEKRYSTEIIADSVQFIGGRQTRDEPEPYDPGEYTPPAAGEDDIPF